MQKLLVIPLVIGYMNIIGKKTRALVCNQTAAFIYSCYFPSAD